MDLHSKKIVGYSFSCSMTTELIKRALENAYCIQKPDEGLIFHSDFGTRYICGCTNLLYIEKEPTWLIYNHLPYFSTPSWVRDPFKEKKAAKWAR